MKLSKKTWIPLLFALVISVGAGLAYDRLSGRLETIGLKVADAWMVQTGGPRFAQGLVRGDIVLIMFDVASATKLGYVSNYDDDLKVYRKLVDAGVAIVYDSRMIASATIDDFQSLERMLDVLLELDQTPIRLGSARIALIMERGPFEARRAVRGEANAPTTTRMIRDVWLSQVITGQGGDRFMPALAQNTITSHPHAVPALSTRLYPLAYADHWGIREAAPLAIAEMFGESRQQLLKRSAVSCHYPWSSFRKGHWRADFGLEDRIKKPRISDVTIWKWIMRNAQAIVL